MGVVIRYLDRAAVIRCGGWDFKKAVSDIEQTLRLQEAGQTVMPPEVPLRWPTQTKTDSAGTPLSDAGIYALPAYVGGPRPVAGLKWTAHRSVSIHSDLPHTMGLIVLNDAASGRPLAVLESGLIGAVRTAAVSAVAIEHLGWSKVRRVAVFGAGFQAESHLRMLAQRMPGLEEVWLVNRSRGRADGLVNRLAQYFPWPVCVRDFGPEAIMENEVVITCTGAEQPYVLKSWVRPGLLAIHVGLFEFSFEAISAFDRIVVDKWGEFKNTSLKSLFRMYRAGRLKEEAVYGELGQFVSGKKAALSGKSVFFNSFGLSIFDVAVAWRIFQEAQAQGDGTELPLF
jgi:ornithine cyclodeaminase